MTTLLPDPRDKSPAPETGQRPDVDRGSSEVLVSGLFGGGRSPHPGSTPRSQSRRLKTGCIQRFLCEGLLDDVICLRADVGASRLKSSVPETSDGWSWSRWTPVSLQGVHRD